MPEEAFIRAWNRLVDGYEEYLPLWKEAIDGDDALKTYRVKEMIKLVKDTGYINEMPYELMLKTLSHFEIGHDGTIEVVFLAGVIIEVTASELKNYSFTLK